MKLNWIRFNDDGTSIGVEGRWAKVSESEAIFYIYGTNSKDDWRSNFDIRRVKLKDGSRINAMDYAESQWMVEYIASRMNIKNVKKLTIVGHSRGGALAQVTAYRLLKKYSYIDTKCVLFGSKRAGNHSFVKTIEPITDSYRHRGDYIPLLPPWPWYKNVKHVVFGVFSFNILKVHLQSAYYSFYDKYNLR